MSDCPEAASPAAPCDPSTDARAARLKKFEREQLIIEHLNRGVSVAEIAAREEVTEKRMRALVSEILARRMPEPPAEFLALQVSRLNEALMVAYSAMSGANLKAVGLVVRIVRELDRYHGFSAAHRRVLPDAPRLDHEDRLAPDARLTKRPEAAPQVLEKAAPRNGVVPDASDPQNAAPIRDEASASFLETPAQAPLALDAPPPDRPETAPQELEKPHSAPGNGMGAEASDPQDAAPVRDEASGLGTPAEAPLAPDPPPADRPETVPQPFGIARIAPGNGAAWQAPDPQDAAPIRNEAFASGLETPAEESLAIDAPLNDRPEAAPQALEKPQIRTANGMGAAWALGGAFFVSPAVAGPAAFRRVNVRATQNGIAAC